MDSVMSPFIIDRDHSEPGGEFESAGYGDDTIDCVLPLHTEDDEHHSVTYMYLDNKFRRVEPTLMTGISHLFSNKSNSAPQFQ